MLPYPLTQINQSKSHFSVLKWTSLLYSSTDQLEVWFIFIMSWANMDTVGGACGYSLIPPLCKMGPVLFPCFWSSCVSVSKAADVPADGLLLISDACLPERTVGLLQAKSDSSLQVIFVVACQVNHIYKQTHARMYTLSVWFHLI